LTDCPWCKVVPVCPEKSGGGEKCDFRDLVWDKDAIFERMKLEYEAVKVTRQRATSEKDPVQLNKIVAEMMDKSEGMKIMQEVLTKEFGVKPKEFKERLNLEDLSFSDKMKIFMKLQALKNKRRSKKN